MFLWLFLWQEDISCLMAVKILLILRRQIRLGLQKAEACRTIDCIVALSVTNIAKYVMIRNTTGMNHLKFPDALTISTVLARLCTPTFRPLHVTQLSNPWGIWEVGRRDETFVYCRCCSKVGSLWRLVVGIWAGLLTESRQEGEDASALKLSCIVYFSLTHVRSGTLDVHRHWRRNWNTELLSA
jgi:hypothetical protein